MTRSPATEETAIADMVQRFRALQERTAAEEGRPLRRGVHAKGVCIRGVFQVLDVAHGRDPALAARLAQGIYSRPASYPATVRFSNSDPGVHTDSNPDLRGLAFCIGTPGSRQDYSLQSAPTLPFDDVRALVVFAKVFAAPSQSVALSSLPHSDQLVFAQTMVRVTQQKRQPVRAYQQLRYWSAAPYRHGPEDVVKYSATPAAGNPAHPLDKHNPNALRHELIRHVNEDATMSSFDFALQLLDPYQMTYQGTRRDADFWIENAAVEWPEPQAPFHTVARLTLLPRSQLAAEDCESMFIDVAENCTASSAPVGQVNRARARAVAASRSARLARS